MAIAKRPKGNINAIDTKAEKIIEKFIEGSKGEEPSPQENKIPIMIRLDKSILEDIDAICEARGMKRSPWIQYQLSEILKRGDK